MGGAFEFLEVEGRIERVAVVRTGKGVWVAMRGQTAFLQRESRDASGVARDDAIAAPMTGRVVKVDASVGAEVAEGDLLVVLEAMKMEYRLVAPFAAKVGKVQCSTGDLVDLGAVLVTLERL